MTQSTEAIHRELNERFPRFARLMPFANREEIVQMVLRFADAQVTNKFEGAVKVEDGIWQLTNGFYVFEDETNNFDDTEYAKLSDCKAALQEYCEQL
jgi:hypothetical protein